MPYVLIVIAVFSSTGGVSSNTEFYEFANEQSCETARDGIQSGVLRLKGTLGREVFTACYPRQ